MELPSVTEHQNGTLYRVFRNDVEAALMEVPEGESVESCKKHLLESIRQSDIYATHVSVLHDVLEKLKNTEFQTTAELGDAVTNEIVNFLQREFTPEQLEELARTFQTELQGRKEINKLLTYDIKNDEVHIHIPLTLTESPSSLKKLFIEGLKKLCHELKENEELAHITSIRGESWIVLKHPKLLEAMGFTIIETDTEKEQAVAQISKERLFELYLS